MVDSLKSAGKLASKWDLNDTSSSKMALDQPDSASKDLSISLPAMKQNYLDFIEIITYVQQSIQVEMAQAKTVSSELGKVAYEKIAQGIRLACQLSTRIVEQVINYM